MTSNIWFSDKPAISDSKIKTALANFLKRDLKYKSQFLQSNYEYAFDGYSYLGQQDSLNQYESDMLHSFVLSNLHDVETFPVEFQDFLKEDWPGIISQLKALEMATLEKHNLKDILKLYEDDKIAYMASCNFYPKTSKVKEVGIDNTRLSAHKDISLFTNFPFGIEEGLSYFSKSQNETLDKQNNYFQFTGYFMEYLTRGKNIALDHQVNLPKDKDSERYSFAIFSIPKPNASFKIGPKTITSEQYYQDYLNLF